MSDNHNAGTTKSTRDRRPLKLIFCEYYLFKKDAMKRERYLKTSAGKRALKFMLKTSMAKLGYAFKNKTGWVRHVELEKGVL